MQMNRLLGNWTMHLHGYGEKPNVEISVPFDRGSVNHRTEASSVSTREHSTLSDPTTRPALDQAIARYRQHQLYGLESLANATEFWTDSHAPIHRRRGASALTTGYERRQTGWSDLYQLALTEWGWECWMWEALLVPTGPLANRSFGVGARYQLGWNDTRDVCCRIATGRPSGKGKAYFVNARTRQDTFASLLVRDLKDQGGFAGMRKTQPPMPCDYQIEKFADGHVTRVPYPLQKGDPTVAWVKYSTGTTGTGEPPTGLGDRRAPDLFLPKTATVG